MQPEARTWRGSFPLAGAPARRNYFISIIRSLAVYVYHLFCVLVNSRGATQTQRSGFGCVFMST